MATRFEPTTRSSTLVPPPPSSSSVPFPSTSRTEPQINDALSRDFSEVAELSKEDMQLLLEDPAYFDAYFNTIPQALALHQEIEAKMIENLDLDGYSDEAQRQAYERFSQSAQLARYRAATTQQERLSDAMVSSFLNGEGDKERFVKQYREVRKVYHKREIGLRKWEEGKVVWM